MRPGVRKELENRCLGCGSDAVRELLSILDAPVDCSILFRTREAAKGVARGDIRLGFCVSCGLISNLGFNPENVTYSPEYENSLDSSARFRRYSESLISRLVEVHELRGKHVVEIGCGNGRFLNAVCVAGGSSGTGFDPGCDPSSSTSRVRLVRDYFSDAHGDVEADVILCRHVLEHIAQPESLLRGIRRHPGLHSGTVLYFEVPNADWILDEMWFWDLTYPHCSYFTATTLTDLFRRCGFSVLRTGTGFEDQFLFVEAVPRRAEGGVRTLPAHDTQFLARRADRFRKGFEAAVRYWETLLARRLAEGGKVVIWGAGAKAVTFTHLVPASRGTAAVVDINPRKQASYLPGSGIRVDAPEVCLEVRPDLVVAMNPAYEEEIREMLSGMGLECEVTSIRDETHTAACLAAVGR